MTNYDLTPSPIQILTTEEQIRAYVHPTRMAILALLAQEKGSISGVARQFGVHPANLTHHFKLLLKAGLIELVEKRETGKNLEKYYRARAYQFIVQASDQPTDQKLLALAILRDNLAAAVQTLADPQDERPVVGILKSVRIHPDDVEKFAEKLLALAQEFTQQAAQTGDVYSLNASLYPIAAGQAPAREIILGEDQHTDG